MSVRAVETISTELRQSRQGYMVLSRRADASPQVLADWAERIRDLEAELSLAVRSAGGIS